MTRVAMTSAQPGPLRPPSLQDSARCQRTVQTARALEETRDLLRASSDALLDPHVFFEAVWDSRGNVIDFIYREINQATCDYVGMSREALRGSRLPDNWPGIADSGLLAEYVRCLDTGQPWFSMTSPTPTRSFGTPAAMTSEPPG